MQDFSKPDGSRGVPQAKFDCGSTLILSKHSVPADKLYWHDGEGTEEPPGWYCLLCHPDPNPGRWRLIDELAETDADLVRII